MKNTSTVNCPSRNNVKDGRSGLGKVQMRQVTDPDDICGHEWSAIKSCEFRVGVNVRDDLRGRWELHHSGSNTNEESKRAAATSRCDRAYSAKTGQLEGRSWSICEWRLFWIEDKFSVSQVWNHIYTTPHYFFKENISTFVISQNISLHVFFKSTFHPCILSQLPSQWSLTPVLSGLCLA
jgi:hypothetical protein